jgi:adenylyl cyclase-associated protein
VAAKKPVTAVKVKEPIMEQRGRVWVIENQVGATINFEESKVDRNSAFQIISCKDSNIIITGKFNNILVENCQNCAVVFEHIYASVEIMNSKKVTIQVKESCRNV